MMMVSGSSYVCNRQWNLINSNLTVPHSLRVIRGCSYPCQSMKGAGDFSCVHVIPRTLR